MSVCEFLAARTRKPVERAGDEVVLQQVVAADHDIVEHTHVVEQRKVLEGSTDTERGARVRLQPGDIATAVE